VLRLITSSNLVANWNRRIAGLLAPEDAAGIDAGCDTLPVIRYPFKNVDRVLEDRLSCGSRLADARPHTPHDCAVAVKVGY
jgi:hypothetical protein